MPVYSELVKTWMEAAAA